MESRDSSIHNFMFIRIYQWTHVRFVDTCVNVTQQWCRQRARQGGLPRPSAVHTVSSLRGTGIPALLDDLRHLVGEHGDVWVVGAQNSGASRLHIGFRMKTKLLALTECQLKEARPSRHSIHSYMSNSSVRGLRPQPPVLCSLSAGTVENPRAADRT